MNPSERAKLILLGTNNVPRAIRVMKEFGRKLPQGLLPRVYFWVHSSVFFFSRRQWGIYPVAGPHSLDAQATSMDGGSFQAGTLQQNRDTSWVPNQSFVWANSFKGWALSAHPGVLLSTLSRQLSKLSGNRNTAGKWSYGHTNVGDPLCNDLLRSKWSRGHAPKPTREKL